MSDIWTGIDEAQLVGEAPRVSTGKRRILNLVEENLRSEVNRRRGRKPHAQLRVDADATVAQIDSAFRRQIREYAPQSFKPYGCEAMALAEEIVQMLADARERLVAERSSHSARSASKVWVERECSEATLRALETVRGAIARHRAEAIRYREAGRIHEAVTSLEAVLRLDRDDSFARKLLPRLRELVAPKPWWFRLAGRWLG